MNKKIKIGLFALFFLMYTLVYHAIPAQGQSYTFKQNEDFDFRFRCIDVDNNYCTSSTQLLISVEAPNGTNVRDNVSMTHNPTFYNVSLPTSNVGTYSAIVISPSGINTTTEFTYEINPSGQPLSTPQGVLYFIMLLFAIIIFGLSLYGAIKIKWKHTTDNEGFILGLNNLRYAKLFLWFMTYMVAIWITALASSITRNFLFFNRAANFFTWIYWILMSFLFPIIVLMFVVLVFSVINQKKIMKAVRRGLKIRV